MFVASWTEALLYSPPLIWLTCICACISGIQMVAVPQTLVQKPGVVAVGGVAMSSVLFHLHHFCLLPIHFHLHLVNVWSNFCKFTCKASALSAINTMSSAKSRTSTFSCLLHYSIQDQPWRESATLPYTLIHFKPLLMFLPHLHSHLTLHVQKLYCPHKLLSHLSLCQSFPQLHSVHSVIRFLRSRNAANNHLLFFNCFLHNLPQPIHIRALSP